MHAGASCIWQACRHGKQGRYCQDSIAGDLCYCHKSPPQCSIQSQYKHFCMSVMQQTTPLASVHLVADASTLSRCKYSLASHGACCIYCICISAPGYIKPKFCYVCLQRPAQQAETTPNSPIVLDTPARPLTNVARQPHRPNMLLPQSDMQTSEQLQTQWPPQPSQAQAAFRLYTCIAHKQYSDRE